MVCREICVFTIYFFTDNKFLKAQGPLQEKTCQKLAFFSWKQSNKYISDTVKAFNKCMDVKEEELRQANKEMIKALFPTIRCTESKNGGSCIDVSIFGYPIVFRFY